MSHFQSRSSRKMASWLAAFCIAAWGATGSIPAASQDKGPDTLTVMVGGFDAERFELALDPGGVSGLGPYGILLHGFLIDIDEKGQLIPGIATKWELSPDALTWTFTIRQGVKFHDGSDLTAADVLWTLQHTFGPGADKYIKAGTLRTYVPLISRIEQTGPDTVAVKFKEPNFGFPALLSPQSGSWVPIYPKRGAQHDEAVELEYDRNPVGAGPMKLVKHVQGQEMVFERFDDFYQQPKFGYPEDRTVKFKTLDLLAVPEEAARIAALRAGRVDLTPVGLSAKDQVEAAGARLVFSQYGNNIEPRMYGCWNKQFPCHDKRVRQALDYAIDKSTIQTFYGGPKIFEIKGWYRVAPITEGYTSELDPRPFDPEKARQLLAEAGYPGGAGFGRLILNTFASPSVPFQVETAQVVAEGWRKELGLDVEVKVWEPSALRQQERAAGPLYGQMTWQDNEPQFDASLAVRGKYDGTNKERFVSDPDINHLVNDTFSIVDQAQRLKATQDLYVRLRDESYNYGIGLLNTPWAVGSRVASWQPVPMSGYPSAIYTLKLTGN